MEVGIARQKLIQCKLTTITASAEQITLDQGVLLHKQLLANTNHIMFDIVQDDATFQLVPGCIPFFFKEFIETTQIKKQRQG
ncbi:hypothetical protein BvCmsSIP076_00888 [Escherichia coli]|nr:hypothetical protein BvCmsSIP076_00888 [Escherichia coli]